jgi:hypothetical protein
VIYRNRCRACSPEFRAGLLFLCLVSPLIASADELSGIADSIVSGTPGAMARYRYEFVDQASFDKNANASTILLRLNYETIEYKGLSLLLKAAHFDARSTSFADTTKLWLMLTAGF